MKRRKTNVLSSEFGEEQDYWMDVAWELYLSAKLNTISRRDYIRWATHLDTMPEISAYFRWLLHFDLVFVDPGEPCKERCTFTC